MEPPRVYIETTIPSAYFDTRTAPEMIRRREATRRWWADAGERYELVTGPNVRKELREGPEDRIWVWLSLIRALPSLAINKDVVEIAVAYRQHKLMPPDDALHLAVAAYYRCDYLLTWDVRHLANVRKFGHIQRVHRLLGQHVPRIVTPLVLLEEEDEQA